MLNNLYNNARAEKDPNKRNELFDKYSRINKYIKDKKKTFRGRDSWYGEFNDALPGVKGMDKDYNSFVTSIAEDYVYEHFGERVYDMFMKWAERVNFEPTLYGTCRGGYDDYDGEWYETEADINTSDAFEYELNKLNHCPVLTPEQIEELKEYIIDEIETKQWENNDLYEPPSY
jgi:hypothetical protein